MKVVHLASEVGGGGAARSALNLHLGLLRQGIDSTMLVGTVHGTLPPGVVVVPGMCVPEREFWKESELLVWRNRSCLSNTHFSLNFPGWDPSCHDMICGADVINLHWVSGSLSASSVSALSSLGKPVVWTLHDMRPLTGGCHFPSGCDGFSHDCSGCPQLTDDLDGMTRKAKALLTRAIVRADVHFVSPSSWIRERVNLATSAGNNPVSLIPYGVDLEHFTPGDRMRARNALGLRSEPMYILLAAHDARERRKGFEDAADILGKLKEEPSLSSLIREGMIRILMCGHRNNGINLPGYETDHAGHLDYEAMPDVYRAANLLLFTSLEDNLPNVMMEALSCGLPVASHNLAGVMDLAGNNGECGVLFPIGNTGLAVSGMTGMLLQAPLLTTMGMRARSRMENGFSLESQAIRYTDLYSSVYSTYNNRGIALGVTRIEEMNLLLNSLSQKKDIKHRFLAHCLKHPSQSFRKIASCL